MPTNFPSGVMSSGVPLFGGIYPFAPGTSKDTFFVDPFKGGDTNDGKSIDRPLKTINQAIKLAAPTGTGTSKHRYTNIYCAPGQYQEAVDVTKPNIAIIGSAGRHPGISRITGDGTTARASVRVLAPNLRGFVLANMFVETGFPGTASLSQPAIHLQTDDTKGGDSPTTDVGADYQNYHFFLNNVMTVADLTPTAALLLEGATFGRVWNSTFAGCVHGVVFVPRGMNAPSDVHFNNIHFYNNVTADVTTSDTTTITAGNTCAGMDSIMFNDCYFWDIGGTPVTNYINMAGTTINGGFYHCFFNRHITDGTLAQFPVGMNVVGSYDTSGLVSIIGA